MVRMVDFAHGRLAVPSEPEGLIERFLAVYGEWGECELRLLAPVYRDRSILDLGAYVGTFTLGALDLGASHAVAVEPNPAVFPLLERNIGACVAGQAVGVQAFVGGSPTNGMQSVFWQAENLGTFTRLPRSGIEWCQSVVEVPTLTLAELREQVGPFEFLKLDVEGNETEALHGDREWLADVRPPLWLECNEDMASLGLYRYLRGLGYRVDFAAYPSFRRANYRKSQVLVFPLAYEAGLFAHRPDQEPLSAPEGEDDEYDIVAEVGDEEALRECLWRTPRWALEGWAGLSRGQLIALLGRAARQEHFEGFLRTAEPS